MHRCGRRLLHKPRTKSSRLYSALPTLIAAEPAASLPQQNALTLIYKTSSLLPSVLSLAPKHSVESLKLWTHLLDYAHNASRKDSENDGSWKARIVGASSACLFLPVCLLTSLPGAVHGVQSDSCAFDFVTALLEDGFSSNAENTDLLRSRPRNVSRSIQFGPAPAQSSDSLLLSSQWLTRFPAPVEILELPTATSPAELFTLLTADIPVVVLNPIVTSLSAILQSPLYRAVLCHPHAILVIIGIETPETRSYVQSLFAAYSTYPECGSRKVGVGDETVWTKRPKVIHTNPSQALESLHALTENPGSLQAIGVYQHGRLSSRISDFDGAVRENLTEAKVTLGDDASPRTFTAIALLHQSLNLARRSLDDGLHEVSSLTCSISELLGETDKARDSLHSDVLGVWDSIPGKETGTDEVKKAMIRSKEDVKLALDRLKWWKLLWRVDDVQGIINAAIQQRWCKDLERRVWHLAFPLDSGYVLTYYAILARLPHRPFANNSISAERQDCAASAFFQPSLSLFLLRHIQQLPTTYIVSYIFTLIYCSPPTPVRSKRHVG